MFKFDVSDIGNGELDFEASRGIVDIIRETSFHWGKVTNEVHRCASNSVPASDRKGFDRESTDNYGVREDGGKPQVPCLFEGLEAGVRGPLGSPILMAFRISGGRELYPAPCPRLFDLINAVRFI